MRGKKVKNMVLKFRVSISQGKFFKSFCEENGLNFSDLVRTAISGEINRIKKRVACRKKALMQQQFFDCGSDVRAWARKHNNGSVDMSVLQSFASPGERTVFLQKLVDGGVKKGFSLPQILDFIRNKVNFGGSVTLEDIEPIYKTSLLLHGAVKHEKVSH